MKDETKSRRLRERLKLSLPVRVACREAGGREWTEMTRLLDVTPFGAKFSLSHPTEPGRLLRLTMAMPRQLRCFDYVEMQYSIWALVRHIQLETAQETKPAQTKDAGGMRFVVGTAFIGKHAPASHETDPSIRYEVVQTAAGSGLWEIREMRVPQKGASAAAARSGETRLQMAVEVVVEVLDERGVVALREETVTENISRRGAAVYTSLQLERGRFVRLMSMRAQISVLAVVRARRPGPDGIPRLHLEFVDRQWPLEGVD